MKKSSHRVHRSKKIRHSPPGTAPGAIVIPSDALELKIKSFCYNQNEYFEKEVSGVSEIRSQLDTYPANCHWFDIKGFGDKNFLEQLADCFNIHRLQMEDVVNVYQRPKAEEFKGHLFFVSRMITEKQGLLLNDQLSIFLGSNFVITIQDKYDDILEPVRERIRHGKGNMRKSGSDYLAYSLMDMAIDNFYPILERTGDRLDELQDELLTNPTRESLNRVLETKRDLILLRRTIWSERDKMNDILRSSFTEISDSTKVYFRDSYDHCIQLLDLIESYKEVTASLMDVYHSSVSFKLNQVMKVLTIISTIFIPLTFIVGLYGMNFSNVEPGTGKYLPLNMPELYSPYGYVIVCAVMLLIVIGQIIFFYKKGWLTKG
ncbi:MAG: magnesium/cobalt transporter CorA [Bacteroidia bacterium]|nr:magnesium/cobalt transporter CorA [Bacteroidia bacterium]